MAAYRMTAARKSALRKAQMASARKRRGKGKGKLAKANRTATRNKRIAVVAATGGLALAATGVAGAYYAKKLASGGPKRKTVANNKVYFDANLGAYYTKKKSPKGNSPQFIGRKKTQPKTKKLPQIGKARGPVPIPSTNLKSKIVPLSNRSSLGKRDHRIFTNGQVIDAAEYNIYKQWSKRATKEKPRKHY